MGGLDFASQFRDVGGFVSKDFYQRTDIKLTQIKQCKCKQGLVRLKLPHSNSSWPGIPEMYALDHKSCFLKPSLQFLPRFEEKLQITSYKRLPTQRGTQP